MFPLSGKIFPPGAEALRAALEESLRRVVTPAGPMVTVEEKNYPVLAALRVSLDRANAAVPPPPRVALPIGTVEPALQIAHFEINGQPLLVQRAKVELSCTARDVQLGQGRDKEGNLFLLLQDAADGRLEIAISKPDLEAIVLATAKTETAKQGVTVENVQIELRSRLDRALDLVLHVRARKLFLTAVVRINGSMTIDEQLSARFSGLECAGEGTLGTLACGVIAPHLQRLNGREFSLMDLPLGEVKLRDVRVATDRGLRVTAEFGHAFMPSRAQPINPAS